MRIAIGWALGLAVMATVWLAGAARAEEINGEISVNGIPRSYMAVIPAGARGRRLPAVFVLHGALMNGRHMQRTVGLDAIAEREGIITVYPEGRHHLWNDGRPTPRFGLSELTDDVTFLTKLARRLVDDGVADPRRLYLFGVSNGGMMTFRMACEAPGTFAAYAAIIASMPVNVASRCQPGRGVPMLIMSSTKDPLIPFEGGPLGFAGRHGTVISSEESLEFWRRNNGCEGEKKRDSLPDKDPTDGSTARVEQYYNCRSGAPAVLVIVEGGGHVPPGAAVGARPLVEAFLGKENHDISAADISWKFFRRFPTGR